MAINTSMYGNAQQPDPMDTLQGLTALKNGNQAGSAQQNPLVMLLSHLFGPPGTSNAIPQLLAMLMGQRQATGAPQVLTPAGSQPPASAPLPVTNPQATQPTNSLIAPLLGKKKTPMVGQNTDPAAMTL